MNVMLNSGCIIYNFCVLLNYFPIYNTLIISFFLLLQRSTLLIYVTVNLIEIYTKEILTFSLTVFLTIYKYENYNNHLKLYFSSSYISWLNSYYILNYTFIELI